MSKTTWHIDNRLPRLRRLITAAVAADIATSLTAHNKKRDDFTAGQLLLLSEQVETTWLKMASDIKSYADQTKLLKSTMYKIKLGAFLKQYAPAVTTTKFGKIESEIDELKKQVKFLTNKKRKINE